MLKLFIIITLLVLLSFLEIPKLKKKEFSRERKFYIFFYLITAGLFTAEMMNMPLPNPIKAMDYIFTPISDAVFQFLT